MNGAGPLLAAVALIAFLVSPSRPIQSAALFYLLLVGLSWLWSRHLRESLTVERTVSRLRVPRNERLELVILARNRSRLPIYSCLLSDFPGSLAAGADDGRWLLSIPPRSSVTLRYTVIGSSRGEYEVGPLRFRGSDPLCFFPFETVLERRASVMVLPARRESPLTLKEGIPQGSVTLRDPRYEDVTLFRSIRDYQNGDELRRINWKAAARLGKLYTNEFLDSLNCPVMVFCDLRSGAYPVRLRRDQAERVIETAAAAVRAAAQRGQECGFASTGEGQPFIHPGASRLDTILDELARIDLSPGGIEGDSQALASDRETFARARSVLRSGGRLLYAGPRDPAILAGEWMRFRELGESLYEHRR